MSKNCYAVCVSAEAQNPQIVSLSDTSPQEKARLLLDTDVTERLRVSVMPPFLHDCDRVLCYLIDGRGGEKSLPANICGTCLYHSGNTIYGDLLFVLCNPQEQDETIFGLEQSQAEQLCIWLREQFGFLE